MMRNVTSQLIRGEPGNSHYCVSVSFKGGEGVIQTSDSVMCRKAIEKAHAPVNGKAGSFSKKFTKTSIVSGSSIFHGGGGDSSLGGSASLLFGQIILENLTQDLAYPVDSANDYSLWAKLLHFWHFETCGTRWQNFLVGV